MVSGVYQIVNNVNGKFYIGSSKHLSRRKKEHIRGLSRGKSECTILQRAVNKHGIENFEFKILAYCPFEYQFKLEQWFVDTLKPKYNSCLLDVRVPIDCFGSKGYKYTEEQREDRRKVAFKKLNSNINFGWKSRPVIKLDLNRNIIEEYGSLKECAIKNKCSIPAVHRAVNEGTKCMGFYMEYKVALNIDSEL